MKKNNLLAGIIFCFTTFIVHKANAKDISDPVAHYNISFAPHASFDTLWVDYDVTENDMRGMRIHVKFVAYEMKGTDADVAVFFEDDKGNRLKDKNQKYYSSGGDVALYFDVKPEYDPAYYNDVKLFMPYNELDLTEPGKYDLSLEVKLINANGNDIQHLTYYDFEFTKAGTSTKSTSPTVHFDSLWVNYDVTENNQLGMRIHVKFNVSNMKGIDAYLAIFFEREDGEKLETENPNYQSKKGDKQVAIYKSIKPNYDPGYYEDLQLFVPYIALNLGPGKSELTMDADVIYNNSDLLKHLDYHDFWVKF